MAGRILAAYAALQQSVRQGGSPGYPARGRGWHKRALWPIAAPVMTPRARALALRYLPQAQVELLEQFLKFGTIGAIGFVADTAVVYATAPFVGPYVAGVISYILVGTMNWLLNRVWTYRHIRHGAAHRQVLAFLATNAVGFVINRGTYFSLVASVPFCRQHLVVPLAAAAGTSMFINFFLSRRLVFR